MFRKALAATLLFTFVCSMAAFTLQDGVAQSPPTTIIDINSASVEDVEAIVQDSDLAKRIIDNRPYSNKRQLLSRRLVSAEQYEEIKDRIIARRIEDPDLSR